MNNRWTARRISGLPRTKRLPVRCLARLGTFLACLFVAAVAARADWVTLQNGTHLRGVDLQTRGDGFVFTSETGEKIYIPEKDFRHIEKSPHGEKVEFRGRRVSLAKKIRSLRREQRDFAVAMQKRLLRWARDGADSEEVSDELAKLTPEVRVAALVLAVRSAEESATRRLAARELASLNWQDVRPSEFSQRRRKRALFALTRAAVSDSHPMVRQTARACVTASHDSDVVDFLTPALRSRSRLERIRAARLLGVIEDPRAAAPLIDTLHLAWVKGATTFRQRSGGVVLSVLDYDFVPGTTGFSVRELSAIDRVLSGTVVQQPKQDYGGAQELKARLKSLEALTGQSFGRDVSAWRKWLAENTIP